MQQLGGDPAKFDLPRLFVLAPMVRRSGKFRSVQLVRADTVAPHSQKEHYFKMISRNEVSWEADRHNWSALRAAGSASGIPRAIISLQSAASKDDADAAYWQIDNTVTVHGSVYESALPTTACLLISLASCTDAARPRILELLVQIGAGEPADVEIGAENSNIVAACLQEIARGVPIFVNILERSLDSDERSSCVDLLGLCCRAEPFTARQSSIVL